MKMKITHKILEEMKKLYLEDNSLTDIKIIIHDKYGLNVSADSIRKRLNKIIKLRNRQESIKLSHIKHLPKKEEIISLYLGEKFSLKRIAKLFKSNKKTIGKILNESGVKIRNNDESVRLSNTKYKRTPFDKDEKKMAYLMGLVEGYLTALRKSRHTIRVITNTTHLKFAELIKNKFQNYGHVRIFPAKDVGISSYMWCVQTDLDNSFEFLLPENRINEIDKIIETEHLFNFLAGFIDSDGSIIVRKTGKYFQPVIRLFGQNIELLTKLKDILEKSCYHISM